MRADGQVVHKISCTRSVFAIKAEIMICGTNARSRLITKQAKQMDERKIEKNSMPQGVPPSHQHLDNKQIQTTYRSSFLLQSDPFVVLLRG